MASSAAARRSGRFSFSFAFAFGAPREHSRSGVDRWGGIAATGAATGLFQSRFDNGGSLHEIRAPRSRAVAVS